MGAWDECQEPSPPADDEWREAPRSLQDAVVAVLRARGCPADIAAELASELRVASRGAWEWASLQGMLSAVGFDGDEDREDAVLEHVTGLAGNVADDNAEANDRTARGESGYKPLWPLSDRSPRRR